MPHRSAERALYRSAGCFLVCYRPLALRFWRYFNLHPWLPWAADFTMPPARGQRCLNWIVGLLVISPAGTDSVLPGRARHLLKTAVAQNTNKWRVAAAAAAGGYSQLEKITASGASAAFGAACCELRLVVGTRVVALTAARPKFGSSAARVRVGVLLALADHADGRLFGPT